MITKIIENMQKNLLRSIILFIAFAVGWTIYVLGILINPPLKLAYFDMGKSIIEIKYEGDCGATCGFGDIIVYQKNKKPFAKKKIVFRLKETSHSGFDFQKLSETQIQLRRKSGNEDYCINDPNNEFCVEKIYIVDIK